RGRRDSQRAGAPGEGRRSAKSLHLRSRGIHRSFQRKQPQVVPSRGAGEEASSRIGHDVLVALVLEDTDRRIHAVSGLEFPETFAVRRVERCEPAIVSPDEYEATRCRDGSAITVVSPSLLPYEAVRLHIHSGEDSCARNLRSPK